MSLGQTFFGKKATNGVKPPLLADSTTVFDHVDTASNPALRLPESTNLGCYFMRLTPQIAKHWLENYNTVNRPVSNKTVNKYVASMLRKRWVDHNVVIKFSPNRQINGQHTCHAVIKSGMTIKVSMIVGLSEACFAVEDTGRKRSAADVIFVEGASQWVAGVCGAAAQLLLNHEAGIALWSNVKSENQDVLDFYLDNPRLSEIAKMFAEFPRKHPVITPAPAIALAFLFSAKDHTLMVKFFSALMTGASLDPNEALYHLWRWLDEGVKSGNTISMREKMIATIKTWNLYRTGKAHRSKSAIRVRMQDEMPEIL